MTDARVDILLSLRSQIDGLDRTVRSLGQVNSGLGEAGRVSSRESRKIDSDWSRLGDSLRRKFSGVKLGEALLGALGIGTGLAAVNVIFNRFAAVWEEARKNAEEMERRSQSIAAAMREVSMLRFENLLAQQTPEGQLELRRNQLKYVQTDIRLAEERAAKALRGMALAEKAGSENALGLSNIGVTFRSFEGESFGITGIGGREFFELQEKRYDEAQLAIVETQKKAAEVERMISSLEQQISKAGQRATEEAAKENAAQIERLNREAASAKEQIDKDLKVAVEQGQRELEQLDKAAEAYRRVADPMRVYREQLAEIVMLKERGLLTPDEAAAATSQLQGGKVDQGLNEFFGPLDDQSSAMGRGRADLDAMGESARRLEYTLSYGISGAIQGLIEGTMTWADAFRFIGGAIVNSIINAFADMLAQFLVRRTMMFLFGRKLDAAEIAANGAKNAVLTGQTAAKAAADVALLTPPATLASISSFGLAAAVGVAALAAILAGSREYGGPVQGGRPYLVGERRPEIFVPAVSGTILPSLDSFAAAQRSAGSSPAPVAAGGNVPTRRLEQNLIFNFDPGRLAVLQADYFDARVIDLIGRMGYVRNRSAL